MTSDGGATIEPCGKWQFWSSGCAEGTEVVVGDLDDVEREACPCGYSFVVPSVAGFEPVYAEGGELIVLAPRNDFSLAAERLQSEVPISTPEVRACHLMFVTAHLVPETLAPRRDSVPKAWSPWIRPLTRAEPPLSR